MGSVTLWPVLLALGVIPSAACLLALTKLPQPVIHLLQTGQKSQALKVLLKMRKGNKVNKCWFLGTVASLLSLQLVIKFTSNYYYSN